MRLPTFQNRSRRGGYALVIALCFLSVSLAAYTSMVYWVSSDAKITRRNNLFNQSEAAAESVTESVLANMMRDFNNQSLSSASSYSSSANLPSTNGWPLLFTFSDTNGNANSTSVSIGSSIWTNLPARYTGLYGLAYPCVVASQATPQSVGDSLSAIVAQSIWFASIPIFQFAIFYNLDLEINPGQSMTINGRVHSNQNIYATGAGSGSILTFSTNVEATKIVYTTSGPKDPRSPARSGSVTFTMSANNPVSGASSLSMPIGTNNDPAVVRQVLDIPPAGTDPTTASGQSYIYNKADIIITNGPNTNLLVYYFNQNQTPNQVLIPKDGTNVVGGVTNTYYTFATNVVFYDYRESKTVKAVQIDVGKFNTWLTNAVNGGRAYTSANTTGLTSKSHDVNGIYVYNSLSTNGTQLPAVRVVNGSQLPAAGLTVATPFPLYVKGDYNTTTNGVNFSTTLGNTAYTRPAALMGDAVTILSANWVDTATSSGSARNPVSTTINAACLEGIVESNGTDYSGGLENFLRLLETWGANTLTYNGSIVVLFPSQYATAPWSGSGYYSPPVRQWGFDNNFKTQSLLPPMTPQVRVTIRNGWKAW
jgi:hypothetical protein